MATQEPNQHQEPVPAQEDSLVRLVHDISSERTRIKRMNEPSNEQLKMELAGTSLDLLEDSTKAILGLRNHVILAMQPWIEGELGKMLDVLQGHEERLEILENFGGDTQLLPEHAQLFGDIIDGAKYLATALLDPEQRQKLFDEIDAEGQQVLRQLLDKCEAAENVISDNTLEDGLEEGEEAEQLITPKVNNDAAH